MDTASSYEVCEVRPKCDKCENKREKRKTRGSYDDNREEQSRTERKRERDAVRAQPRRQQARLPDFQPRRCFAVWTSN